MMQAGEAASRVLQNIPDPSKLERTQRKYRASVVENKLQSNGSLVLFHIEELVPLTKGHLTDNPIPMKRTYKDAQGRVFTSKGTHNNNFVGQYFSSDTFRKTPPDVQRGEIIMVWQKGDSDTWFWETSSEDMTTKRRLETVVQAVNADKPKGSDSNQYGDKNTYYAEMSSHNKSYTVSTSEANGEYASYKIQINGGEGAIILQDNLGNYIQIDSKASTITIKNDCKTEVVLEKNDIHFFCEGNLSGEVKGNASLKIHGNTAVDIGGNADVKVGGATNLNSSGDVTITTPNVNINGNLNVSGNIVGQQAITSGGGSTMSSSGIQVNGSADITGTLSANGPVNFPAGGSIRGYD